MGAEWWLLISVLVNAWQFNVTGELKAERDNYAGIVQQCTTDRAQERKDTVAAADAREKQATVLARQLARQEQYSRDIVEDANDPCLNTSSPLGSELVDREQQATDNLNGVWLRGTSKSNDRKVYPRAVPD
jgi:hypothetical protein